MAENIPSLDTSLADMSKADWLEAIVNVADEDGAFSVLGKSHFSAFVEDGPQLLVTFETIQGIRSLSPKAHPLGWEFVREKGWSHLCIVSDGDTWFRDAPIYGYFDRLIDDGFFDEFEDIVFYGAGPCGYAAAAFSVAAPGSRVIAVQPQATLDPRVAGWDERFTENRKIDFTSRYGYAPEMLDAADQAWILVDPSETLDDMHAALFTRANVTKLPLRHLGTTLQTELMGMDILSSVLTEAMEKTLSAHSFAKLYRARRDYKPYLRSLLNRLDASHRDPLSYLLCANVAQRLQAPRFARRAASLEAGLKAQEKESAAS